jgi:hypothetical protein
MNLNPEYKAPWIAALRSGHYAQGRNQLRDKLGNYCCIGVLQMVVDGKVQENTSYPSNDWWYNVGNYEGDCKLFRGDGDLTSFNDRDGLTFDQIADLIEYFL